MLILLVTVAFLLGSIPWGYIIAKSKGVDLRKVGSGNIGATNVLRTVGKKEALFTLVLDLSKGAIPVIVSKFIYQEDGLLFAGVVGVSSILGHCYSPWLKFKGGKGVSTALGVLLAYTPTLGIISILVWIVAYGITKISSVGALTSFTLMPFIAILLGYREEVLYIAATIAAIIILRHRANIKRLIRGEEKAVRLGNG